MNTSLINHTVQSYHMHFLSMPSKGIQVYSYIAAPGVKISYNVPGSVLERDQMKVFMNDHLEVDKGKLAHKFDFTGTFSFTVFLGVDALTTQSVEINTLSGNISGSGTMSHMENQLSIITNNLIICYGFYSAGPGIAGLPSSHQCYVSVTPDYSNWMAELAPPDSPQATKPFTRFVLPAVHDVGMNSMQSADAVLHSDALVEVMKSYSPVFAKIAGSMSHDAAMHLAPNIIRGLAITQKDTLSTMLSIGARYFEFRPAYLHSAIRAGNFIPDTLYFSHSAIPGMSYQHFLADLVEFLMAHPQEIVVTQLRYDGVPGECARPSDEELAIFMNEALTAANGTIVQGSLDDMHALSIQDLRAQQKRLIVFPGTSSYSTYTDPANATLTGDTIVGEFDKVSPEICAGHAFTNLQCQATATNMPEVVAYSVLAANASSSCLLATKPICDSVTLPWIVANQNRMDPNQLAVVMDDFIDGKVADVAIEASRGRLEL